MEIFLPYRKEMEKYLSRNHSLMTEKNYAIIMMKAALWKYKGYDLPQDVPLIVGALLRLIYYERLLHRKPLPGILAQIRNLDDGKPSSISPVEASAKLDKLWRACDFWMVRFLHHPGPCLRRGLVMYRWCRKNRIDSKLVIGVDKNGNVLKGHAWLYVDGRVYREDLASLAKEYTVMLEG